jgi:CheY-like chemotaxis protein
MVRDADIFIVDDNPDNLTLLSGVLKKAGYRVRAANTGRRALAMLEVLAPDLVMLDVQMPDLDGYEVCERLKAEPALAPIPVIFISALDDVIDKVRAFRVGAVDYVTKPFEPDEVLARVEAQVELYALRRELARKNDELLRRNEELAASLARTDRVFSALSEALPGTVLDGRYRLDAKIGSGGFGVVYRATHLDLGRKVAIKVFRPLPGNDSAESLERFKREGVAACRFNHPNAITVTDFGISETGIAYIVMELLRGYTVAESVMTLGALSTGRCAEILVPVCEALAEAHAAGLIHRDVKPANVFLHQTRQGEVVKVLDFGIAKLVEAAPDGGGVDVTTGGRFIGTPAFMAPERLLDEECDGRADVYSVGVMLYTMLSGRYPYGDKRDLKGLMAQYMAEEPEPLASHRPDLPQAVQSVVMSALARQPGARPTARELARSIAEVVGPA